jgi:hypothetical protein
VIGGGICEYVADLRAVISTGGMTAGFDFLHEVVDCRRMRGGTCVLDQAGLHHDNSARCHKKAAVRVAYIDRT